MYIYIYIYTYIYNLQTNTLSLLAMGGLYCRFARFEKARKGPHIYCVGNHTQYSIQHTMYVSVVKHSGPSSEANILQAFF